MAGGCGECPSKRGKSQSKCPESKRGKDDCKKPKSGSSSSGKACDTDKDAFGRNSCPSVLKKRVECHESVKNFFEKKDSSKKCKDESKGRKDERKCGETSKKAKEKCKSKEKTETTKKCPPSKETSNCACVSKKEGQSACGNLVGTSKKSGCKHFGKNYVEFGPKPKPYLTVDKDEGLKMPEPQVLTIRPCLPRVEKGVYSKGKVRCFTTEVGCSQLQKPLGVEFFCIDARNRQLNECIRRYMDTDPSQINIRCAEFMRRRKPAVSCGAQTALCGYTPPPPPPSMAGFLPLKYRQIMRRWIPTAGLYVFATAALTAWVTEWGAVVKHIPFYRVGEEGAAPPAPQEAAEPPAAPSTSDESES